MTAVEILRAARAKIEDPARWCQHNFAQTAENRPIMPVAEDACQWCALGALYHVVPGLWAHRSVLCAHRFDASTLEGRTARAALYDAASDTHPNLSSAVPRVNDCLGHDAVLELYDRAIQRLEVRDDG